MIKCLVLGAGPHHQRRPLTHEETLVDCRSFDGTTDVVHDLSIYPWPFEDNSYDEITAVHLVEHLVDLVGFMNECWRILKPGGALYVVTPEAGKNYDLTHADPTHVRCLRAHSFINYFTISEGPKFQYTDKFWAILDLRLVDCCIKILLSPLKIRIHQESEFAPLCQI